MNRYFLIYFVLVVILNPILALIYDHAYYLALCMIAKDEIDVVEWIEYHHRMGVDKFYVYDHHSSVPLINQILPYVQSGLVHYVYLADVYPNALAHAFNDCLSKHKFVHQFIGFIDADEFIVLDDKSLLLPDFLLNYEHNGGLALNWKVFGSSGHVFRPDGGVLANYNKCHSDSFVKVILNTNFLSQHPDIEWGMCAHNIRLKNNDKHNFYIYDMLGNRTDDGNHPLYALNYTSDALYDKIYINHYSYKSEEDYHEKIRRGRADVPPDFGVRTMETFARDDALCVDDCGFLQMPPKRTDEF